MRENLALYPRLYLGKPVSLNVSTVAVGVVPGSVPSGASGALVAASVADVVWGYTDVATNNGLRLKADNGVYIEFENNDADGGTPLVPGTPRLPQFKFVRVTGTDGIVTFQFYQRR